MAAAPLRWLLLLAPCTAALDVVDTAAAAGSFGTLLAALKRANLTSVLKGAGPFTVFAPTDSAFEKLAASLGVAGEELLARPDLAEILKVHVLAGKVKSGGLRQGLLLQTLQGKRLEVALGGGSVSVAGAAVSSADVACDNGVIHVIDSVLLPPERLALAGGAAGWDVTQWRTVLDGVMGGRSSGSARVEGGSMVFSGSINTNGGGFASIRKDMARTDLSGYAGLWVELETARFEAAQAPLAVEVRLTDGSWYSFAAPVAVPRSDEAGQLVRAFLPMEAFKGSNWRGGACNGCRLNAAAVSGLHLYVLYQSGAFEVKVREIAAVRKATDGPGNPQTLGASGLAQPGAVVSFVRAAIDRGSYVFDKGYRESCAVIYMSTAASVLATPGVAAGVKGVLCAAWSKAAATSDSTEQAWLLRRGFDALLADDASTPRPDASRYPASTQGNWLPAKGDAEAAAAGCASFQVTPAMQSSVPTPAPVPVMTATKDIDGFQGPFEGMGITGHNDMGERHTASPQECAHLCREQAHCRSFDYGARGHVLGQCWLSTADRVSAGYSYTNWPLYDYYEKDGAAKHGHGATHDPSAASNHRSTAAPAAAPVTVSTAAPMAAGEADSFTGQPAFFLLLAAAALILLLLVAMACLYKRLRTLRAFRAGNAGENSTVVMGRPVPKSEAETKMDAERGVAEGGIAEGGVALGG